MTPVRYALLTLRAFWELNRYDLTQALVGFKHIYRRAASQHVAGSPPSPQVESVICDAVALAACFYWKPVYCLQRAVVSARLLRAWGIHAQLIIGYQPSPFTSHAWVEVDGRVVNESPAYKERMLVLDRL